MKVIRAFRNLDRHGQQRAPVVIDEEVRQLLPHLSRFREDLVRLEVVASQSKGKTRIHASLRLQLPSGVLAVQEEGFEIEPVLRKAFVDLRRRVDRHVTRLKREPEWKRPARRARIGALLPAAKDKAEADRRALYFDLIEDHLDTLYDTVRRELTYLECSGSVPEGYLSVRDLVDATILKGLERFQDRPTAFSVGDWLTQLALESIEAEARAARRAVPEDAASLDVEPEAPAEEPTEADQEIFEFYQADEVLRLEDLVSDRTAVDPEAATERHETALALHRAIGDLPTLWRRVLFLVDLGGAAPERAARVLGLSRDEMLRILDATRAYLRQKLQDFGETSGTVERILDPCANGISPMPQPLADRQRLRRFLVGLDNGEAT